MFGHWSCNNKFVDSVAVAAAVVAVGGGDDVGFRIRVRFSGQNFWMTRLMQSSQRGMKESRLDDVGLREGRMMGPTISNMMALQSKGSDVVVKKSSFP